MSVILYTARPFMSRKVYYLLGAIKSDTYSTLAMLAASSGGQAQYTPTWDYGQCDRTFYFSGPNAQEIVEKVQAIYPGKVRALP